MPAKAPFLIRLRRIACRVAEYFRARKHAPKARRIVDHVFALPEAPVLVFQMGKVGSSTVTTSLRAAGFQGGVLQLHFLRGDIRRQMANYTNAGEPVPFHFYQSEAFRDRLVRGDTRGRVITLVRDPVAREVSGLFQTPFFAGRGLRTAAGTIDSAKALAFLEERLAAPDAFQYGAEWFDKEMKPAFGLDVFAEPFPKDLGWKQWSTPKADVLLLRMEDLDRVGEALGRFAGLPGTVEIASANTREETPDAAAYREVRRRLKLPRAVCERIYGQRLVRHFYPEAMIEQFIRRWSREDG